MDTPTIVPWNAKSPSLKGSCHGGMLATWISLALLRTHWDGHPLSPGVWARDLEQSH